jgi:hypothetical protein
MKRGFLIALAALVLAGCAAHRDGPAADPWPAMRAAPPRSILVLPVINNTPDVDAPASVAAQTLVPLAEAGYYPMPLALVGETLRINGLQTATDAQAVSPRRLHEVFGADAALYLTVKRYGSVYAVVSAASVTTVEARLVDLKTGDVLWSGAATASSDEGRGQPQGGLLGLLVQAVVEQVASNFNDRNHQVAGIAVRRLFSTAGPRGLPPGPRLQAAVGQERR